MKPKKTHKKYDLGGTVKKLTGGQVGAIAQGVMGAGQAAYGIYQASKAGKEMERLRASAPSLSTPGEYFQAYKQAADQSIMERQMESVNKQLAGGAQALGAAGGRALLGGLGAMTQGAQETQMNIADMQSQRQQQALQALAAAQGQTQTMKEGRYQQEMAGAQAARDAGLQNVAGGLGAIGSAATMGFAESWDKRKDNDKKNGGVIKTPGQFSHDKNPIDIVKGGAKIGEMTGGEYIFNPTQMSKIKGHVAGGDKEALHRYVKGLIKKFEK